MLGLKTTTTATTATTTTTDEGRQGKHGVRLIWCTLHSTRQHYTDDSSSLRDSG